MRTIWRLTRNKLDIDGAAELQRQVAAAETLTLLAEDLPMLLIAGSLQFAATRSSEPKDPTTATYLLLVVIFSAVMIGMKLNNVRPLLNRLLADRTYEESCAEMAQLSADDLCTLESVLSDYDIFESLQRSQHGGHDDDKSRSIILSVSTNRTGGGESIEQLLAMSAQDLSGAALDLQRRIFRLLRELSKRPLDMDSPQSHLDALAVVLELAYPERYGHLERSAEATAQALTAAAVSQSEFYAVVLPYLMLLYDKEGAPSVPSERAAADAADAKDVNANALAGLAGTAVRSERHEASGSGSEVGDNDDSDNPTPGLRPMHRAGFSMVRVVRMREEELERLATMNNLRPSTSRPIATLQRPQLQLTVHSASDDTRAQPLSPMVPHASSSPHNHPSRVVHGRRLSTSANQARNRRISLHDVPMVMSPGVKDASGDGFALSIEAAHPQTTPADEQGPGHPQPKSSMRKLASRTRRQLERQIVMFADDGLEEEDDDDNGFGPNRRSIPGAPVDDDAAASGTTTVSAACDTNPLDRDGSLKRFEYTRTFVKPSDSATATEDNDHDEVSPPLAVPSAPSARTLRRQPHHQSAAYLHTRARFIHAVRQTIPHRK